MRRIKIILTACLFALIAAACGSRKQSGFIPGAVWEDNNGRHINAHGGGILLHDGTWYWFGESKSDTTNNALAGVSCYTSRDLYNWTDKGIALAVSSEPGSEIESGCIIERPKVIYNAPTKTFVMWFHLELKDKGYLAARSGLAVSSTPEGPYKYVGSCRPNAGSLPLNMPADTVFAPEAYDLKQWSPEWKQVVSEGLYAVRDMEGGQMARDMTLYVDDDGKAYHIYASEENSTLQIAELSADYQSHTGRYIRVAPGGFNEAPAIFKKDGRYYMITSGCTGWAPNAARLLTADSMMGEWTQHPNPCIGDGADKTFESQSTFILPAPGHKDSFIFMADRWTPDFPSDGRYVWLPIQFNIEGAPYLEWKDAWSLDFFKPQDGTAKQ